MTVTAQLYALILYLLLALKILEINVNNKFIEKILNFSGASEKEPVNYNIRTDLVICSVILFFVGILWLNENLVRNRMVLVADMHIMQLFYIGCLF